MEDMADWASVSYCATTGTDGKVTPWRCENLGREGMVWAEVTPREWAEMRCAAIIDYYPPDATVYFTDTIFQEAIREVMAERYPERQYAFVGSGGSWAAEVAANNLAEILATWDD